MNLQDLKCVEFVLSADVLLKTQGNGHSLLFIEFCFHGLMIRNTICVVS